MGITTTIDALINKLNNDILGPDERLEIERRLIALILEGEDRLVM